MSTQGIEADDATHSANAAAIYESRDVSRGTSAVVPLEPAPLPPIAIGPGMLIIPLLQLQDDMQPFEANVEDVEGQCERAVITTQDHYQGGSDILSAIQGQLTQIEDKRATAKKPADDYGKMVQNLTVPLKIRLEAAKKLLTGKMLVWRNAEEARQKAAQDAIRKQQQEEADRIAAEARARGNEKAAVAVETMMAAAPVAPAPKIGVPNTFGRTQSKRTYWLGDAQDNMEILRNIVAGKLPIHLVEFSKAGMNSVADSHIKTLPLDEQKDMLHLGIKITKSDKLV